MPINIKTYPDEETHAIILHISIPVHELEASKIIQEFYGHPTPIQLLQFLLEKAQEALNGEN